MGSPNLTSKFRSICVNSVIASRNLDRRVYDEGDKMHYSAFPSSSEDKIVKFLWKEWTYLFLGFQLGYTKFHFYIQPLFLGAYVQPTWGKLWLSGRFVPKLYWHVASSVMPCPGRLVHSSQGTYLSGQTKVNIMNTAIQMVFQLAQSLALEMTLFQLTAAWKRESRCYHPYFTDEKAEAQRGSTFWGNMWKTLHLVRFGCSCV